MTNSLQWKKYPVLNDGFICLVDSMGTDASIVQAARVSYGRDARFEFSPEDSQQQKEYDDEKAKDINLIRYLLRHGHTTPFEMCEVKFLVRVPMDCWRQWIRHRTASVNEYSTRYTEAIDSQQTTSPREWRLQTTNNKQGSSGFLEDWPECWEFEDYNNQPHTKAGNYLTQEEEIFHEYSKVLYQQRLAFGIAKEQARKDLPLSTYTEAYWKCDLHNIFNFLRLRMDSHAQLEIRSYANAMAEIVKQLYPVAWQAFEDYQLNSMKLTALDITMIQRILNPMFNADGSRGFLDEVDYLMKDTITNKREREECITKLTKLGIL